MKVMVTGARGQLGQDLTRKLAQAGHQVIAVDVQDFDLTDSAAVQSAVEAAEPNAIIHCAAYTAVDRAETEPETCCAVNAIGTLNLARAAVRADAKLLYISTDYVFHGDGTEPYEVNDPVGPRSIYGLSKLQGEEAVRSLMTRCFIVRISWVFGAGGKNFIRTMLRLSEDHREVRVVNDQVGSPTYTPDLSDFLCQLIVTDKYGIYHATNEGTCTWAELAERTFALAGRDCRVIPVPTSEYPTLARRPLNSRLSKACLDRAGFSRLPPWEDALARFLQELRDRGELN